MKLDTHVHTLYSGRSTIRPLHRFVRESYNTPEQVYRLAKTRGMDLVAITDHDCIEGALAIADRPDVIVGCEVTAVFKDDDVRVHLGVLGITEAQHREIQQLRRDVTELLPYLRAQRVFTSLNHVASRVNGPITGRHVAALLPWVDGIEVLNGSRLASQNRTAASLAAACRRVPIAGSDAHTGRGIGRTWIEVPEARTREEFLEGLHRGRVRVGGRQGHYLTMASDIVRIATAFQRERMAGVIERPLDWRRSIALGTGTVALSLAAVALVVAFGHFILEDRFNRNLLFDLVAEPSLRLPEVA